jgi:hypothetical protein
VHFDSSQPKSPEEDEDDEDLMESIEGFYSDPSSSDDSNKGKVPSKLIHVTSAPVPSLVSSSTVLASTPTPTVEIVIQPIVAVNKSQSKLISPTADGKSRTTAPVVAAPAPNESDPHLHLEVPDSLDQSTLPAASTSFAVATIGTKTKGLPLPDIADTETPLQHDSPQPAVSRKVQVCTRLVCD